MGGFSKPSITFLYLFDTKAICCHRVNMKMMRIPIKNKHHNKSIWESLLNHLFYWKWLQQWTTQ